MVFFSFQQDANGQEESQVLKRRWYFLIATIPLTCIVFTVWIIWQGIRFHNHQIDDDLTKALADGIVMDTMKRDFDIDIGENLMSLRRARTSDESIAIIQTGRVHQVSSTLEPYVAIEHVPIPVAPPGSAGYLPMQHDVVAFSGPLWKQCKLQKQHYSLIRLKHSAC
jgi:hypothetical protein